MIPWAPSQEDPAATAAGDADDLREMVYSGSIAAGDLLLFFFVAVYQDHLEDLASSRKSGFGLRIVRVPKKVVHTDDVAVANVRDVFLEASKDIGVEVIARQHRFLKPIALLLDRWDDVPLVGFAAVRQFPGQRRLPQFCAGLDCRPWFSRAQSAASRRTWTASSDHRAMTLRPGFRGTPSSAEPSRAKARSASPAGRRKCRCVTKPW